MPILRANHLEIGYELLGAGPPLVLLHAASSSPRLDFAAQLPGLASTFLVHLPDARGHGSTRWDAAAGFQADWLVDDLEAFADGLGLATLHLLGFSMGALTALAFAVRHPERVRTIVLGGISTEREPRASVVRHLLDPARIEREDPAWSARLSARLDPGQGHGAWHRLLPAIAADVAAQPLLSPGDLRRVAAPALVACGDRDPFVPVDQAWRLARQVVDGRLLVAPDCGHELLSERPGLLNEALAGFYRSTEAVARRRADASPAVDTVGSSLEEPS